MRSASVVISLPSGGTQSFSLSNTEGDVWENTLTGFTDGSGWAWRVEAKDGTQGKGNTSVSGPYVFNVDTAGAPPSACGLSITNRRSPIKVRPPH